MTLPDAARHQPGVAEAPEAIVASFAQADVHTVDLSGHVLEDWICLVFFWTMTLLVFLQFFTRYVLNDSFAWTEELAVYCLIPIVFIGASACVRRARHIQVNFIYRYLGERAGRSLSTAVDVFVALFCGYAAWLVARYTLAIGDEPMTTVPWSKSLLYWLAFGGFALMTLRALQVAGMNWRRGYSALQRPEAFDGADPV
jgi:TRAP-type C4-dicarboxylate transport system permease small subunit